MDRQQLIAAWAQMVADGMDNPPVEGEGAVERTFGYDPQVERKKLQWEREKNFDGVGVQRWQRRNWMTWGKGGREDDVLSCDERKM